MSRRDEQGVVIPSGNGGASTQSGRDRARDARLKSARERRLRLDPDQLAREQRIDEAVVDVEVAWEARSEAEQAVADAEVAPAAALGRLLAERLAVKDMVRLTGLDQITVRRLRQLATATNEDDDVTAAEAADVEVA
ncbi:hypothetical protein DDE18_22460 [Nocardioides gansuensis]|uniref:Uncharacterized protein n=1 Tax=Nocardioides gansuensis TaxID=2138300 RepID=A0A2T8F4E5_9ACTN|nr:hypothetical protein [Nocardioides gansuensis]PVG80581.1 hypothetical protein DDE18_22460 [Nocardioides gansuensis]